MSCLTVKLKDVQQDAWAGSGGCDISGCCHTMSIEQKCYDSLLLFHIPFVPPWAIQYLEHVHGIFTFFVLRPVEISVEFGERRLIFLYIRTTQHFIVVVFSGVG